MTNMTIKEKVVNFLRWSEKYTGTDMIYLARGGFWLSLTSGIISIITFVKMIVFGRYLSQEIYGIYGYVISITGILTIFSLSGMGSSILKSIAQKKEGTFLLALKTKLKWGLIGSFLSLIISFWYFINENPLLGFLFLIVSLFVPFISTFDISLYYYQGRKEFYKYAKYEILTNIFLVIVVIPAIILTNDIILIVFLFFFSQFLSYGFITKKILNNLENKKEDKNAIVFGKHITLINSILIIAEHIDKMIIWKLLGPAQVAIYSFAQIPLYKLNSFLPISTLALPKLGERNIKEIKTEILKKFGKLFLMSVPLSLFAIIIAPFFYKIAIPQYIDSTPYFRAFAVMTMLLPFSLISSALISNRNKKELYIINIIVPSLKILLFIVLGPFFGIWGIISAILISRIIGSFFELYFFMKI